MKGPGRVLAGVAALGWAVAACRADGPVVTQGCSAIGCNSGVQFDVAADLVNEVTYQVQACIDGDCRSAAIEVPPPDDGPYTGRSVGSLTVTTDSDVVLMRLCSKDYSGRHHVALSVTDPAGTVVATADTETEFEQVRPNGPDCPPTCWTAQVRA